MSLYLKYRPQDFQSMVGQEHVKKTLQSAVLNDSLSHAYLFCGPRGTGKTSLARILAKRINCLDPKENEPCNQCEICRAIQTGRLVDLIEIDAASNRGIDEIRDLREKIAFTPSQAKAKVYIIDEVHMLTKEAFNALLKTLEEPPSHAFFILATTEAHKIPETIVSRCQQFSLNRISVADIAQRLEKITHSEGGEADREALELIAKLSNGGLRDAIGLLEQMMLIGKVTVQTVETHLGLTGLDHLEHFFNFLLQKNPKKAMGILTEIKSQGKSIPQFLKEFIEFLRSQLHLNLAEASKTTVILDFIEHFLKARSQLDLCPLPELAVEMAIIRACGFYQPAPVTLKEEPLEKKAAPQNQPPPPDLTKIKQISEETPPKFAQDLDFEAIKKSWPRVLEHIPTAFVRMSLADGELETYDAQGLTLRFKSATYMEKIEHMGNQKEVQDAFETVYGRTINLRLESKKIELSPLEESPQENHLPKTASVAEMAAEVFGIKK